MNSYKKLCTEFYDIDKPNAPTDALDFYLRYAEKASGPILEPMCGSGRFLIPLMQHGFDIDGADASPQMLEACRENCRRRSLKPALYEQFVDHLELPRKYGLVMIPAGSFCLITESAKIRQSLERIYALMLPGAQLVLEVEMLTEQSAQSGPWGGRWVERPDGAKIVINWLTHYDANERIARSIHRYELIKDGSLLEMEFEDYTLRFYDPEEFRRLLETSGFTAIKTFKTFEFRPPDPMDATIVFECSKL